MRKKPPGGVATLAFANFTCQVSCIRKKPNSWKGVYIPAVYNLPFALMPGARRT